MSDWVERAEQLPEPYGEIARMYLHGPEAREYEPEMVVAAMAALGIDITEDDVALYRNPRKAV